ncbi:MAG: hypothetical protein R6X02_12360 [Enhygromyxa sp.]
MRSQLAWLGVVLCFACTGKRERSEGETASVTVEQPADPRTPDQEPDAGPREPPRKHLLVLAHEPSAARAILRPVELDRAEPRVGEALEIPTLPYENWPDHFRVIAAHGGGDEFVVAHDEALQLRRVSDESSVEVELGGTAAALHMVGDRVFVGQGNRVLLVDFGASPAKLRELRHRPEMRFKAYDLFAHDGGWLIAIDDVVTPIFADSFELRDGEVQHRAGFELPGAINGHYQYALLHARGPGLGTLYAIIPYGIMSGSGHDLVALPMRDAAPTIDTASLIVNGGGKNGIPVLEEHVPRGRGEPQLLAGDRFTAWTGLARVEAEGGGRLLIAAGERGLLTLADDFDGSSRPIELDIGGSCLDVFSEGARVFVLRGPLELAAEQPLAAKLVELSIGDDGAATTIATIELDGPYRSIVR